MGKKLGSAKRARKLARLFEVLRQVRDRQDAQAIAAATINSFIARNS